VFLKKVTDSAVTAVILKNFYFSGHSGHRDSEKSFISAVTAVIREKLKTLETTSGGCGMPGRWGIIYSKRKPAESLARFDPPGLRPDHPSPGSIWPDRRRAGGLLRYNF